MTNAQIIAQLAKVDIFSNSTKEVLEHIAKVMKVEQHPTDFNIIQKGDEGNCMYVMIDGKVKIHDREHTIVELEGIHVFGEMALLNPEPRAASVSTISPSTLLRLDQEDFYNLLAESPAITEGIIRMLTSRIRNQNESIIKSLEERERKLIALVEERTADLQREKQKLELAYREISIKNDTLQAANAEIAEKTKNIQASINYAKRIQDSLLPQLDYIKRVIPESFVIFKPRDIVSGDCYWFSQQKDSFMFAAIDCTGHGVPGALMSMIGTTLINQIVNMKGETRPEMVLNLLNLGIRKALKQDDEESQSRDGMDLALIKYNPSTGDLHYAGANRPMLVIEPGREPMEIPPDKISIGGHQKTRHMKFSCQHFKVSPETIVYLSTDGYADQFGGPNNKKFMKKRLRDLLISISDRDFEVQQAILEQELKDWMQGYAQIDDILLTGFKLP